jgi:hypothetical protein
VPVQKEFADGERTGHDFTEQHRTSTSIENGINRVVGSAIGAKAQRWRRVDRINGGARAKGAPRNGGGCQRGRNGNVQAHPWAQLQEPSSDGEALLFQSGHRAEWVSHPVSHAGICIEHRAAQLRAHADRIGIEGHECLVYPLPRLQGANKRECGGIGAISGWGCQPFTLGPTLYKDASLGESDKLIERSSGAELRVEISNVAQLICKCRRIKEFPRGVGCASAGGGIRREELPRRNGLTMGHHKVAHQRNLAAWLQANRRWLTQSRR